MTALASRVGMPFARPHFKRIRNIRWATDLCGLYGIRPECRYDDLSSMPPWPPASRTSSVVFGLGDRYTISGPVWEYYSTIARARAFEVGRSGRTHERGLFRSAKTASAEKPVSIPRSCSPSRPAMLYRMSGITMRSPYWEKTLDIWVLCPVSVTIR